jgi:hypothetical protein
MVTTNKQQGTNAGFDVSGLQVAGGGTEKVVMIANLFRRAGRGISFVDIIYTTSY